jgi:hypothetical protein
MFALVGSRPQPNFHYIFVALSIGICSVNRKYCSCLFKGKKEGKTFAQNKNEDGTFWEEIMLFKCCFEKYCSAKNIFTCVREQARHKMRSYSSTPSIVLGFKILIVTKFL